MIRGIHALLVLVTLGGCMAFTPDPPHHPELDNRQCNDIASCDALLGDVIEIGNRCRKEGTDCTVEMSNAHTTYKTFHEVLVRQITEIARETEQAKKDLATEFAASEEVARQANERVKRCETELQSTRVSLVAQYNQPESAPTDEDHASAKPAAPTTPRASGGLLCRDGSMSPTCTCAGSHRGCCSHHGGVSGCQ